MRNRVKTSAIVLTILLWPAYVLGQDSAANGIEKCSSGYAYDAKLNECVACNQPCNTGVPGICGRGIVDCSGDSPVCASAIKPGERMEVCNAEDDDCDGSIDEGFDKDSDGYTTCGGDCDDRNAAVHPDAVERCDGEDNNCNGLIDDGFNVGGACTVGLGECAREGKRRCQKSGLDAVCDAEPGGPSDEICDGKDNDCNGVVDDGLGKISCGIGACGRTVPSCVSGLVPECRPGQPSAELCGDGMDNDCDGDVDEGFPGLGGKCFEGVGGCRAEGKLNCSEDGLSVVCSAGPGKPGVEICGNAIDDDCDGEVDTDVGGLGEFCTNGLLGECLRDGKNICDKISHKLICSAPLVKPSTERCDGKDSDCDGEIDNDVEETAPCGKGACIGGTRERVCSDGDWGEWSGCSTADKAIEEICGNRIDDNCNGIIDDDAIGLGSPCDNGLLGACFREGRLKCEAENGKLVCSAGPVDPSEEICDGIDDDCDGKIDEGVTNACGECGELPGDLGEPCHVPDGDVCATGIWACRDEPEKGMECALEPKRSDGKICTTDDNPCTLDACQHGKCSHPPLNDGLSCDDGNPCTVEDVCVGGACHGGAQLSCSDENQCTMDACDPIRGCYHSATGGGVVNICGGCEILKSFPGESCVLADKTGACRQGRYICQEDGALLCVQSIFESLEECNGMDDDCDGEMDEGFGTSACGIGVCQVTVNNCEGGEMRTCLPRDPVAETCVNTGTDDDCNGIVDDIAGLDKNCPVALGTCIVPGKMSCVGDAEFPKCVVLNPEDAEDEDGDGIVNYCDHGESISRGVEMDVGGKLSDGSRDGVGSSRLFDLTRTRTTMLPWQYVYDAVVIAPDSPDQAMLIISGANADGGGIAAIRAKNVSDSESMSFQSCDAPDGELPNRLIVIGDIADIIASTKNNYVRYPKIASQIPSAIAGNLECRLRGKPILSDIGRVWKEKGREYSCQIDEVVALNKISSSPLIFAGASKCVIPSGSIWKRDDRVLGIDVFAESPNGAISHDFAPFMVSTQEMEDVHVSFESVRKVNRIFVTAKIGGKRIFGACQIADDGWFCWNDREDKRMDSIAYMGPLGLSGKSSRQFAVASDGRAFEIEFDSKMRVVRVAKAGETLTDEVGDFVSEVIEFPRQMDRSPTIIVASDELIAAALIHGDDKKTAYLKPSARERFLPESIADDIYVGGRFELKRPHAMAFVPLKNYGGQDLFVVFDILKGRKKIGEMGFFYWNANEWPAGSLVDVSFDGKYGTAKLAFEDPTGDPLTYRAAIRANHGGSLDNWIDGLEKGLLRFSVKGDAAAVGVWPIKMRIEASDPGGLVVISKIVLRRDGTVEVISEAAGAEN